VRWLVYFGVTVAVVGALLLGPRLGADRPAAPLPARSNIERSDYVGPDVCGDCHRKKRASWRQHLHRSMNAVASSAAVVGDFDDAELHYGGGHARFTHEDEQFFVDLDDGRGTERRFAVTRTIGSHYIQEYVGRQVRGPEPPGDPIYQTEVRLPFGYWRRKSGWFHQQYYDSWFGPEYADDELAIDPFAPDLESWEPRCPWCHNTYAFDLRLFRSQGPLHMGNGIERFFALEHVSEGVDARADSARRGQLPLDELVTIGISCESCHLGGRQHAEDEREMHFGPEHPDLRASADAPGLVAGRRSPQLVNALCAQCHSAPSPRYPHGGAHRNSSEALDLEQSACAGISCIDCHDPHVRGTKPKERARQLAACTTCHGSLRSDAAARAHSRHELADASCLDCHMPAVVQGFSGVIRTHRIGRALEPSMVEAGQPNACNLCHLERSVAWAAQQLAVYWGRSLALPEQGAHEPAGPRWLAGADAQARVIAAAAYARSPQGTAALPALLEVLDQPVAYQRMRVLFAIEELLGRPLDVSEYDPTANPERRRAQREALLHSVPHR